MLGEDLIITAFFQVVVYWFTYNLCIFKIYYHFLLSLCHTFHTVYIYVCFSETTTLPCYCFFRQGGSYGKCIFNFIRNCQTVHLKWLWHFVVSPALYEGSSFSASLPTLKIVSLFNLSHFDGCVVVFNGDFHFYFPSDEWCWVIFHELASHEVSFTKCPNLFLLLIS